MCISPFVRHLISRDIKRLTFIIWGEIAVSQGFPGGSVVKKKKNPPADAGDMGSIPDLGRSHMLRNY